MTNTPAPKGDAFAPISFPLRPLPPRGRERAARDKYKSVLTRNGVTPRGRNGERNEHGQPPGERTIGETGVAGAAPAGAGVATGSLPEHRALLAAGRDYLALTKPRIIGLLLVTTVATMFVADPSGPGLATILWTVLGGYLAAGAPARSTTISSATVTRAWTAPAAGPWWRAASIPATGSASGSSSGWRRRSSWPNGERLAAALALAGFLGYVVVYTRVAEAADPAEHRHRRRRRRRAAARRLGSRHRRPELGRALSVRDRLPVDPAPLLGARPADQGRLRARADPDAARSPAARPPPGARSSSTAWRWLPSPSCPTSRASSTASIWPPRWLLGGGFLALAVRLWLRPSPSGGGRRSPRLAGLPGAPLLRDGGGPSRRPLRSRIYTDCEWSWSGRFSIPHWSGSPVSHTSLGACFAPDPTSSSKPPGRTSRPAALAPRPAPRPPRRGPHAPGDRIAARRDAQRIG